MEYDASLSSISVKMQQLANDPEYQRNCQRFKDQCMHLTALAEELLPQLGALREYSENNTVRKEYASGSTLHRGYYCPSPTYDIIVGNAKRGKLLKRMTARSKPSHEYGFDAEGKLLYCKTFYDGHLSNTEYLVHEGQRILGVTFNPSGYLSDFTEEVFHDDKLLAYSHGIFIPQDNSYQCFEVAAEYYEYDQEGLCTCDMHNYLQDCFTPLRVLDDILPIIPKQTYQHIGKFRFQRQDGLLISYLTQQGHEYQVYVRREA